MAGKRIQIGAVTSARGIKGEVFVKVLTDFPERFDEGNKLVGAKEGVVGEKHLTIEKNRSHNGKLILKFKEINNRNEAELLKGYAFYTEEPKELEKDQYYIFDLEGMEVFDLNDNKIGILKEVLENPANDIYSVETANGELLVPALKVFIKDIDVSNKIMHIDTEKLNFEN